MTDRDRAGARERGDETEAGTASETDAGTETESGTVSADDEAGADLEAGGDAPVDERTDRSGPRSGERTGPASTSSTADDEPDARSVTMSFDGERTTASQPQPDPTAAGELRYRTTPMLRPVLLLLGTVLLGGSIALAIPVLRPTLFGDPILAEIVQYAIAVLLTVTVVRLVVRLVVLWRTQYEIREDALIRRYNLAYKRSVRKIPVSKLRGHEFSQSRYQALLGVGTIRLLTAGTNRSLGFLAFEHLREPDVVQTHIQTLLADRERERE